MPETFRGKKQQRMSIDILPVLWRLERHGVFEHASIVCDFQPHNGIRAVLHPETDEGRTESAGVRVHERARTGMTGRHTPGYRRKTLR